MGNNSSVVTYRVQVYGFNNGEIDFNMQGVVVGEWLQVATDFTEGYTYFGSYDALQAAKYVATAAEKLYISVRVLRAERLRTFHEEEVDFHA